MGSPWKFGRQLLEAPGQLSAALGSFGQLLAALDSSWTAMGTSWQLWEALRCSGWFLAAQGS